MRTRRPVLRFLLIVAAVMAVFYGFTTTIWFRARLFPGIMFANARIAASVLRVVGYDTRAEREAIVSPRFSVNLRRGCDAAEPTVLFAAAVAAFPAAVRARVLGLIVGVAWLQLLNLARILSLFWTGVHWPSAFEIMHVEVWQTAFIVLTVATWVIWAVWALKKPKATNLAPRD